MRLQKEVGVAVDCTVTTCFNGAGACLRQAYSELSGNMPENVRDISVSYNASWMTRRHRSLYGIGSVIDLITWFVIACTAMTAPLWEITWTKTVLSLYCHDCSTGGDHMDKDSTEPVLP